MQKVGNAAGDLAQFLLPLKVGMMHKSALLAFSISTFFIRWVWPLTNALLDANVKTKQGKTKVKEQRGSHDWIDCQPKNARMCGNNTTRKINIPYPLLSPCLSHSASRSLLCAVVMMLLTSMSALSMSSSMSIISSVPARVMCDASAKFCSSYPSRMSCSGCSACFYPCSNSSLVSSGMSRPIESYAQNWVGYLHMQAWQVVKWLVHWSTRVWPGVRRAHSIRGERWTVT